MVYMYIEEALKRKKKKAKIRGWVYRKREQKEAIFLIIRDSSGIIQCVIKKGSPFWKDAQKVTIESSVEIEGMVRKDKRAPGGYEIQVQKLKIVGLAETFPIGRDLSDEFLLDVRHLWLRSQKMTSMLKIRSAVFGAIHDYFRKKGFYEFQSPIITPTAGESGSTQFAVDYFGKKAYLAQTWQLYAEAAVMGLEKIYTIAPSFRAERSKTARHLTEYWHAEAEVAWVKLDGLIKIAEELVSYICQYVAKKCPKELKFFGRDPKELKKIKPPFPKLTYTQALEKLKRKGLKIKWGKDLRTIEEKTLGKMYDKPLIVTHYPKKVMAFYKPADPAHPKTALCFDVITPETGVEIIGGSERDLDIEAMKKALKEKGENLKSYEWYFDTRRYGAVPHSGFGMGVDRVVQWICKLKTIKDAIAFPRTPERCEP